MDRKATASLRACQANFNECIKLYLRITRHGKRHIERCCSLLCYRLLCSALCLVVAAFFSKCIFKTNSYAKYASNMSHNKKWKQFVFHWMCVFCCDVCVSITTMSAFCRMVKPKFHYANFATKFGTSSRQSRGHKSWKSATQITSPIHDFCHGLSWFVSADFVADFHCAL